MFGRIICYFYKESNFENTIDFFNDINSQDKHLYIVNMHEKQTLLHLTLTIPLKIRIK